MTVLVTGGAGFIGRAVVGELVSRGESVVAYDNLSNGSTANVREFQKGDFRLVKGDVVDPNAVKGAFADAERCIHLAAVIEVQRSLDEPLYAHRVNVDGTANVLEACRKGDVPLTVVSTCMVYDAARADKPITEDHPLKPASPYAATKLAADFLAMSYHRAYGLPVTVIRPFNTYGPFQKSNHEGGVVAVFLRRALEGKPLQVYGNGTQTRDLMYVADCADLIVRASYATAAVGHTINGGSGKDVAIRVLARRIAGPRGKVEHIPHPHPMSEIRRLRCDPSKAKRILGWEAACSIEEGLRLTREWLSGRDPTDR